MFLFYIILLGLGLLLRLGLLLEFILRFKLGLGL
jgi:hypothetical protein